MKAVSKPWSIENWATPRHNGSYLVCVIEFFDSLHDGYLFVLLLKLSSFLLLKGYDRKFICIMARLN